MRQCITSEKCGFPHKYWHIVLAKLAEIKPTHWPDYMTQFNQIIKTDKSKLRRVGYIDDGNLFLFNESMIKKILEYSIQNSAVELFVDEDYQLTNYMPETWVYKGEKTPDIYKIYIRNRCILCDEKPPKKLGIEFINGQPEPRYYRERNNKIVNVCPQCAKIIQHNKVCVTEQIVQRSPIGTMKGPIKPMDRLPIEGRIRNVPGLRFGEMARDAVNRHPHLINFDSFFKFRHYKIILIYCVKYDSDSLLGLMPTDIIDLIIKFMSAYRFKIINGVVQDK